MCVCLLIEPTIYLRELGSKWIRHNTVYCMVIDHRRAPTLHLQGFNYGRTASRAYFSTRKVASISAIESANARGYIRKASPTFLASSLPEKPI